MNVQVRRHILNVAVEIIIATVFFVVFIALFFMLYLPHPDEAIELQLVALIAAIVAGGAIIYPYLAWTAFVLSVNPHRIIIKDGILLRRSSTWDLTGAQIECRQTLVDRALERGTLIIHTRTGRKEINNLGNFSRVRRILCQ